MVRQCGIGDIEHSQCDGGYRFSPSASAAFWLTGVAPVPIERLRDSDAREEGKLQEGENAVLRWRATGRGISSDVEGSPKTPERVMWFIGDVGANGRKSNTKHNTNLQSMPSSSSPADVRACISDETVMCNLVPMLPRTHAEYGFVSQIVPCTLWPPPPADTKGEHVTPIVGCLQQAANLASRLHHDSIRSSSSIPFSSPDLPGALVEWVTGSVGYTTDTEGLWEEQRVVAERYYHLPPLLEEGDNGTGEYRVTPSTFPPTLKGAVIEQLRRFRHVYQLNDVKPSCGGVGWVPRFARLVDVTKDSAEELEKLVAKQSAGANSADLISTFDSLLDEIILVGIMPSGQSHRLSLLCPSEVYRMLTRQEKRPEHESEGDPEESCQAVREVLFNLIVRTLRDTLHRRIGVQYELLRILRVKALALANRDLILQYTRWYSNFPTPLTVMRVLLGSTLFGSLAAQRWSSETTPRVMKCEAGMKRGRENNNCYNNGGEDEDCVGVGAGDVDSEPTGGNEEEEEEEEEEPFSASMARDGMSPTGRRPLLRAVSGLHETDLLDVDYMKRFADWLRCHGGSSSSSSGGSHTSGVNVSGGGVCDEAALTATIGWLRRRGRTMTLQELDAFVRKRH